MAAVGSALILALAALVVLFSRPDRAQNRRLALVLGLEAVLIGCAEGLMYMTEDAAASYAYQMLGLAAGFANFTLYLRFYATLENPLSRAMRRPWIDRGLVVLAAAGALIPLAFPRGVIIGTDPGNLADQTTWEHVDAWVHPVFFRLYFVVVLLGFVFTLLTWRSARGGPGQRQATLFLAAFGWRDLAVISASVMILGQIGPRVAYVYVAAAGLTGFVLLLAYGILKAQLFDIDLKIKWTIRRGTVLTILAVVFVVVAEVAQNWLSDAYGYVAGGLAAGALLLALRPLDRVGARVADTAMPRVDASSEYLTFRKHEVYRQALADARMDGVITERERAILDGLRRSLGIDESVAREMETSAELAPARTTA